MDKSGQFLLKYHAFFSALGFTFVLFILEQVLFSQEVSNSIFRVSLNSGNYFRMIFHLVIVGISLLLTFYFFLIAFSSSSPYKIFYFLIFCFGVFIQYGFLKAFNRFIIIEDFQMISEATASNRNYALTTYINYIALLPCCIFGLLLFFTKSSLKRNFAHCFSLITTLIIFFSLTSYFTHNSHQTISFTAFIRTSIGIPVNWYLGSKTQSPRRDFYYATRQKIDFKSDKRPTNNVIIIIDESVRGDHLSLNGYSRITTPFLDKLNSEGFIKNWGISSSGATCSVVSNNLLLTGLTILPDTNYNLYKFPTIFQYAKAMNYKTYYLDGQSSRMWFGKETDLDNIDIRLTPNDWKSINKYEIDAEIAQRIKEITNESVGNFIWVNKLGTHVPYRNAYPKEKENWSPIPHNLDYFRFSASDEERKKIINEYDNALSYNSKIFFSNLLESQVSKNNFYIYTSDHGQTLSQNGETHPHCKDTKNEANVPLFIITNPINLIEGDTEFKASHSNIFATLLDLMDFPKNERKAEYPISLLKAKRNDSQPRLYFTGDIYGKYHSQQYLFD